MKVVHDSQIPKSIWDLLESLTQEVAVLAAELKEVKAVMAVSEVEFNAIQNKVVAIEEQITEVMTQISGLGTSLDTEVSDRTLADESLNSLVDSMAARLEAMEISYITKAKKDLTLSFTEVPLDVTQVVLPITDEYGSDITWSALPIGFIDPTGVVTHPTFEQGNQVVTLSAIIQYGEQLEQKDFVVTVIAQEAPAEPEQPAEEPPIV